VRRMIPLAALVWLAACGHKARPTAPELVRPEAPGNVAAIVTPDGIRVSWLRPQKYTAGGRMNDLGGFTIERATAVGEGQTPVFRKVGTVTLDDQTRFRRERRLEWVDKDVTRGTRYLYRVIAVTLDGYHSAPGGPVAVSYRSSP
jgi:hypothetical protein